MVGIELGDCEFSYCNLDVYIFFIFLDFRLGSDAKYCV